MKKIMLGIALLVIGNGSYAQTDDPYAHEVDNTYTGKVADIINDNCVVCHRPGGIGPMSFESYELVRPWAPLIKMRVENREMPPYAYDHGIGIQALQGDWRLTQEEIYTIVAWVNSGSPYGDPDVIVQKPEMKDPEAWNFESDFGAPDAIIASTAIDIPANGNDLWHKHLVPTGLTEDRCIKAVQVKPRGNAKAVVHHANSSIITAEGREGMLTEYAMGKWGEIVPEGVCRTIPANAEVSWDIHMFPGGLGAMAPGAVGYAMTQGFHSFDHPVRLDSFQPHGHLRMNAASLEIFYPETGVTEPISQISNWSATWHHSHLYNPSAAPLIPAGAVIILKQWYDNTAANPNNPDPDMFVMGGSRTGDEMTHAWLAITHLDDEGYKKLKDERNGTAEIANR